jgi:hypothetical protein
MNYETACFELEIDQTVDITIDVLKRHYKLKALRHHPDKNNAADASEKFQTINNAYQYLLKHLEFIESDDEEDEDYDGFEEEPPKTGYRWVLYKFLKNILAASTNIHVNNGNNNIFYKIIEKISSTCENKAIETLEKLDKQTLIPLYEILNRYRSAFHFTNDFFTRVDNMIKRKIEDDECIVLRPTIDDLFENNVYKLKVEEATYIVPLWHHELVYDHFGNDLYVKCIPELDTTLRIDEHNNICMSLSYEIKDIWEKGFMEFTISNRKFVIQADTIKLIKTQKIILHEVGISRMNTKDIYNISKKADIIVTLELSI